jgi:toxin secretion/phage lysis holin
VRRYFIFATKKRRIYAALGVSQTPIIMEEKERRNFMKENMVKIFFTAAGSLLSSVLGVLYVPVLLMVLCNVIDYITGLIAAQYRKDGISSYRSMKGIFKKVSMWLLVIVGAVIDSLISYTTETLGMNLPFTFLVAAVVAVWIVCNELISILENMIDIGVDIPAFLMPLVKQIKKQTESAAGEESEEKEDEV